MQQRFALLASGPHIPQGLAARHPCQAQSWCPLHRPLVLQLAHLRGRSYQRLRQRFALLATGLRIP